MLQFPSAGQEYDLPVLPDLVTISAALKTLSSPFSNLTLLTENSQAATQIPKIIWLTMKNLPDDYHDLPENVQIVLDQNSKWGSVIADDKLALEFMQKIYPNTSLLWAYESINPVLGAAKADIWRYAVLYAVGGVYIDADAAFMGKLDDFIKPNDKIILSSEKNIINPCYKPDYYLYSKNDGNDDRVIIQWMILTSPQHVFLEKSLINLVNIVKSLYQRQSVLLPDLSKFQMLLCTTGPWMFSNTIKNVMNSSSTELVGIRFDGKDYRGLHGIFKWGNNGPDHYLHLLKRKYVQILQRYENYNVFNESENSNQNNTNNYNIAQNLMNNSKHDSTRNNIFSKLKF